MRVRIYDGEDILIEGSDADHAPLPGDTVYITVWDNDARQVVGTLLRVERRAFEYHVPNEFMGQMVSNRQSDHWLTLYCSRIDASEYEPIPRGNRVAGAF